MNEQDRVREHFAAELRRISFALDHAPDAAYFVGADLRFIYVNETACRTLGYSREEFRELTVAAIAPDSPVGAWEQAWARAREQGAYTVESRHRTKDGRLFAVEMAINYCEFEGQPYACVFARDIGDRREAEEERAALARRARRLQSAIVELATDQALVHGTFESAARKITEAVARAMDVERVAVWRLCPDAERLTCVDLYVASTGVHTSGTVLQVADYPAYFAAMTSGRAIDAGDVLVDARTRELADDYLKPLGITSMLDACIRLHGEPVGVVCHEHVGEPRTWQADETAFAGEVADQAAQALANAERRQDEDERRRLELQMQQAQKLESLGVLAGGIAHDFNNLLMAILGNADLALAELPPDSPLRGYLKEVDLASRRAAELCKQMLAYSGKGRFAIETLDLGRLIDDMAGMLEVAVSKKIELRFDLAADLPLIEADAAQLRQVIMNLVTNASEAIGDATGEITVRTGFMFCDRSYLSTTYFDEKLAPGGYSFVEVSDTGCGMDRETCDRVFDPFFTTKFTGRGLGMAAVLGIVRGHQGALRVDSAPGEGSTFRVLFPAARVPQPEPAESFHHADDAWRGQGAVLLIDDEEKVRAIGKKMLEGLGFDVLTAADGREGLEVYRRCQTDVVCVLLDLTMPRMDGEACFHELRRIRGDVRVLLTSGYDEQEVSSRFVGTGPAGFVQKPYRLATLRESMQRVLAT